MAHVDTDVCVVGGGPAGAALACRLAVLGHHVTVVERHAFPRPHVGESVSAGVWPLLELLGARERVDAAGFPRAVESRVRWGGPEQRVTRRAEAAGLNVDRGRFDQLLLDSARAAGANVLQPATARRPLAAEGGWEVPLATEDGRRTLRARYLADASGRRRVVGGRRRRTGAATLALHGLWRDATGLGTDGTLVDAGPESWYWGAHLPDGVFRAMAFVDPELVRRRRADGDDFERVYRDLLAGSPLFRELSGGPARLVGRAEACDATCYADERPIDGRGVKVGEAAFAIDPLSSSGVQTAMQTAVAATAAVHTILSGGDADAAVAYYREHQRHAVERHARLAAESYAECAAHAADPFWRRRRGGPVEEPAPSRPAPPLRELLALPVRLHEDAALVATPSVVGDGVELRRALTHSELARPVAFLGGAELAPLLDDLRADRPLVQVVDDWARSVSAPTAYSIAEWLADRGLLAPAGPCRP